MENQTIGRLIAAMIILDIAMLVMILIGQDYFAIIVQNYVAHNYYCARIF